MFKHKIFIVWVGLALVIFFTGCNAIRAKTSYQGQLTNALRRLLGTGNACQESNQKHRDDALVFHESSIRQRPVVGA